MLTYSHGDATYAHVGTQAFPYSRKLPKEAHWDGVFPLIEEGGHHVVHIGRCADEEEYDEEEGLEVEERRLLRAPRRVLLVDIACDDLEAERPYHDDRFVCWMTK